MLQKYYHIKPIAFVVVDGQLIKVMGKPTMILADIPIIQINNLSLNFGPGSNVPSSQLVDDGSEGHIGVHTQSECGDTNYRLEGEQ